MADETSTTHETAAPHETIVIRETQASGGGAGWAIALVLILGLIAGFWLFSQSNQSQVAKDNAIANAADSKVSIERTAQQKLAQQARGLGEDNARLREELAIFESMLSADSASAAPLSVLRFKVEPDMLPGEFRYRVLMLASGPRRGKDFQGRLELVVNLTDSGRSAMITVPGEGQPDNAAFRLGFKHFQRVDGTFRVDPKAKVVSVQLRVYETGSTDPKVTRSVTL